MIDRPYGQNGNAVNADALDLTEVYRHLTTTSLPSDFLFRAPQSRQVNGPHGAPCCPRAREPWGLFDSAVFSPWRSSNSDKPSVESQGCRGRAHLPRGGPDHDAPPGGRNEPAAATKAGGSFASGPFRDKPGLEHRAQLDEGVDEAGRRTFQGRVETSSTARLRRRERTQPTTKRNLRASQTWRSPAGRSGRASLDFATWGNEELSSGSRSAHRPLPDRAGPPPDWVSERWHTAPRIPPHHLGRHRDSSSCERCTARYEAIHSD